ncbi:helix-turn-helix domain-containing protein [Streptomyces sp. SID486]|nr:helix-turn-helix domain-containing protein [Streptomyces sp. SID486]
MSSVMTTDSVPDRKKAAFWADAVSRALVPVAVTPRDGTTFTGTITTDRLGFLRICRVEAGAQRVSRTPALIGPSPEDLVAVVLQTAGAAVFVQGGRRTEAGEGSLVCYDTTRPFTFVHPERFTAHVFQLPRHVLGVADDDLRQVTGTAIGTGHGFGSVLLPFLTTLAASAPTCPPAVGHRLAGHVVDLFATLIAERAQPAAARGDAGPEHLVRSVRVHIDRNLGDPSLSPESVARAHRISVRYLHRLFEGEGVTVSRLIQRRRLEECGRELARRGRVTPTVSSVAQRWGFVSPAHFSRAFRAAYGVSPREWRDRRARRGTGADDADPAGTPAP